MKRKEINKNFKFKSYSPKLDYSGSKFLFIEFQDYDIKNTFIEQDFYQSNKFEKIWYKNDRILISSNELISQEYDKELNIVLKTIVELNFYRIVRIIHFNSDKQVILRNELEFNIKYRREIAKDYCGTMDIICITHIHEMSVINYTEILNNGDYLHYLAEQYENVIQERFYHNLLKFEI